MWLRPLKLRCDCFSVIDSHKYGLQANAVTFLLKPVFDLFGGAPFLENIFIAYSKKGSVFGTVFGSIKILIGGYDGELFGE